MIDFCFTKLSQELLPRDCTCVDLRIKSRILADAKTAGLRKKQAIQRMTELPVDKVLVHNETIVNGR